MDDFNKYYGEVPMGRIDKQDVAHGHDQLHPDRLTGRLRATLEARQALHIGSGMVTPPEKLKLPASYPLVKEFFRAGSRLVVPATSIKGAIRSLVEAFTHSCAPATREAERSCRFVPHRQEELCPACRVFGAMGFQGAFRFDEGAFLKGTRRGLEEVPPQYQPRGNISKRRYYPHTEIDPRARTWPLEVIKAGAKIRVTGMFTNIAPAGLGLALIALGQGEGQLCPKLGAGKSAGLGSVQVVSLRAEQMAPTQSYTAYDPVWQPVDLAACVQAAADTLVRADALAKLAQDLSCQRLGET